MDISFQCICVNIKECGCKIYLFIYFCLFAFARATPAAYGSYQARGYYIMITYQERDRDK